MVHKFKSIVDYISDTPLMWNYRIVVPDDIIQIFKTTDKRIIYTVNGSHEVHGALLSKGDGTYNIVINKAFRKQHGIQRGDDVLVEIKKDETKYGMPFPDFFEELCFQDPEGNEFFHSLTPGKRRSLLHIIGKLKNEEKQLEKALIIFDYLKSVNGALDFKELNEAFKTSRFKN